jgi:micrococcal nuclease
MSRKIRRDPRYQILSLLAILLVWALSQWLGPQQQEPAETQRVYVGAIPNGEYAVERVVDGDTLLLKKDRTRVRLQGIDTPETVKEDTPVQTWGPEATAYSKRFVQEARGKVTITVDGEAVDQYGRHLVFVWNGNRLLNEELVAAGLARAKLAYDYSQTMKDRLRAAQDKARAEHVGIWSR